MEIRQLRYAVLLAEEQHFGRASARAFITQSALSQQIARLESRLGTRLFERGPRGVVPTPAGDLFLARARRILDDLEDVVEQVHDLAHGVSGTLRIGIFGAGAGELTSVALNAFRDAFPRVVIAIRELSMSTQVSALLEEQVDVAFVHPLFVESRLETLPLLVEPRFAAVPARHAFAEAPELSIQDLEGHLFVTAREGTPAPWRAFWSCEDIWGAGSPRGVEMDSVNEGLAAVAYLGAVDTVPESATRFFPHPDVSFVPLRDATPSTTALVRRRGDPDPLVAAFCELTVRTAERHRGLVPSATAPAS